MRDSMSFAMDAQVIRRYAYSEMGDTVDGVSYTYRVGRWNC